MTTRILLTLLCLLTLATSASAEEPKGFLRWPWGTSKEVLGREFLLPECNYNIGPKNTGVCLRYRVGDVPAALSLAFDPNGVLSGYVMLFDSMYLDKMRDTAIEKFGPPRSKNTIQHRTPSGALVPGEEFKWQWPSGTEASLTDVPTQHTAIFGVATKALADFSRKEEGEKKRERKKGF